VLPYDHEGPHWNESAQLSWYGGVPLSYQADDSERCAHYCAEIDEVLAWFDSWDRRVNPG
jgi:hypothetical protein